MSDRDRQINVQHVRDANKRLAAENARLVAEVKRLSMSDEETDAISFIAIKHSRAKCDGHRPGSTKAKDLDIVWSFLERHAIKEVSNE